MNIHDRVAKLLDFTKEIKPEDIAAAYQKAHAEMVTEYHSVGDKAHELDAKVTATGQSHPWLLVAAGMGIGMLVGLVVGALFLASHVR